MRVLVAEDNPVFQAMLLSLLKRWGYEVVSARDGLEAWTALQADGAPRLAILDWMMPGLDGVEICRRLRVAAREPYIYILLLTARSEAEDLVLGMDAGADDYLTKPFNSHELRVRLRAGQRILDLQEELLRAREALRDQASRDGLTGLWNRGAILEILRRERERSRREDSRIAVLMIDLDYFKNVNDTWGHLAGDVVLREVTRRMKGVVRAYDSVGRYGGEEFLVVLPGCGAVAGMAEAERIRAAVASTPFVLPECELAVTCSVGIASLEPGRHLGAERLLYDADQALYAAKNSGRNRVHVAAVTEPADVGAFVPA